MQNTILIILSLTLCSMSATLRNGISEKMGSHRSDAATVILKYGGTVVGQTSFDVAIRVVLDTSIGFRYEVTFSGALTSHVALFYKFSKPYQTTFYNFLTHKSEVIKGGNAGKETDVSVIGKENINGYGCTHLQQVKSHETQDYWMSTSVAGFAQLSRVLNNIDPNLKLMVIDQSIFNYGGLVKMKLKDVEPKTGESTTFTLSLTNAQTGIPINLAEFEVPSK